LPQVSPSIPTQADAAASCPLGDDGFGTTNVPVTSVQVAYKMNVSIGDSAAGSMAKQTLVSLRTAPAQLELNSAFVALLVKAAGPKEGRLGCD
jgi:hypothetical protein